MEDDLGLVISTHSCLSPTSAAENPDSYATHWSKHRGRDGEHTDKFFNQVEAYSPVGKTTQWINNEYNTTEDSKTE